MAVIQAQDGRLVQVPDDFQNWTPENQDAYLAEDERAAGIGSVGEFFRGVGRGVVEGTIGATEMAGRGLHDIYQTAEAAVRAGLDPEREFEDYFLEQDLAGRENITSEVMQDLIPAGDPTSFAARAGEITGGLVGGGGVTAGTSRVARALAPGTAARSGTVAAGQNIIQRPIRSAAGAAGIGAASAGGGQLAAEQFGEEYRPVGELVGGVVAPTVAQKTLDQAVRIGVGAAPDSREMVRSGQIYDAQVAAGMQPSAGSIGNPRAAYLETSATAFPVIQGSVARRQGQQLEAAEQLMDSLAADMRPPSAAPAPLGASGPAVIGARLRDAAETGLARIDRMLNMAENRVRRMAGGANRPVRPISTRRELGRQSRQLATGEETTGAVRGFGADLAADTRPIAPRLQESLSNDLAQVQDQLDRLARAQVDMTTPQVRNLQTRANQLRAQMRRNEAVPLSQMGQQRTRLGPRTDQPRGLPRGASRQLYRAMTRDIERTIGSPRPGPGGTTVGGPEALNAFRNLKALESRLYRKRGSLARGRDIEQLRLLAERADDKSIYQWISSGGDVLPWERFALLKRNMSPGRWRQFSSDFIERMGMAKPGGQDALGEVFSPAHFITNWNKLDEQVRSMMLPDPNIRARMDRAADVMEGLKVRQMRGNPSGTAMFAIPLAVANQALGGGPDVNKLRQALSVTVGALLFRTGLLSDRTARALSDRLPSVASEVTARTARAVPAQGGTSYDAPLQIDIEYDDTGTPVE